MLKIIPFATMILVLAANAVVDEPRQFTLDNTFYHQLPPAETGQNHELVITLPHSYQSNPKAVYPVLYYLDAYWDAPLLNSVYNGLDYDNAIPEFIMVGLSYPQTHEGMDYGPLRLRDMTPTKVADSNSGGAAGFLAYLQNTVVPLVESRYRVNPKQRALAGSSLGGLFALYAMYQQPAFFDRYIAISPAVYWDQDYLAALDNAYAKKHKTLEARLFLSYGTEEYKLFRKPIAQLQKQLAAQKYKGLALKNYQMEGLRHAGVKAEGYTRGLLWVWQDLAPKGPSGLETEFQQQR